MLIAVVVIFIIFVMIAALVMLLFLNRAPTGPESKNNPVTIKTNKKQSIPTGRHIDELFEVEFVHPGIFYVDGKYMGLARIGGTNFSVLSDGEQDTREEALIGIQNQIKYPVQYITSTVVTDTDAIAREIRSTNTNFNNELQVRYNNLYAAELEEMKRNRQAMTQVSWLVISDDGTEEDNPVERIKEKMALLHESFRSRVGIILTPLELTEEVVDAIQQMILPEKLSRPSDMIALGGLAPVKFNIREIEKIDIEVA
ncbi:hypothetical protein SAMN05660649_04830 [Desulfotomaculum arcticum]|uniref:Uncharacterized protein n=1 Tax=Desulfotruncus arcticus DSM 17038 TaxID=1121424 RepID=A0A1I2Z964_9FIRM|nr:hypothetical protein [Desulfotruncus arcticus]SFH34397.1 hypothetical protein SAMN05660649_04830 [Desulfotomaculum arcticum] [Desulfotruncus arcticus DSM 17038]